MEVLYIIIPAYNEEANIGKVIEQWYPVIENHNGNQRSRLVIIDDGSKDQTAEIVEKYKNNRDLLELIVKKNSGHGSTLLHGYRYALDQKADYIFQTDSDGQTLPEEFEAFWKEKENYDMVIGWRKHRQDGVSRKIVTFVLKVAIKVCFKETVTDANTPYRIMKASTLKRYIDRIPQNYNLSNVLISVMLKKYEKVKFIPITFKNRQGGVNSINIPKIMKIGMKAIEDFIDLSKKI